MKLTMPWSIISGSRVDAAKVAINEVRRTASHEADRIAQVAAQLRGGTGKQAMKVTRDAGTQVSTVARQLAASGRKIALDLGHDVQSLGGELRHVRITTEPRRTGPNLLPGLALVGGVGVGVGAGMGLMYLLDPELGARRRAALSDRIGQWLRIGRERATGTASEFRNRTVGVMYQVRQTIGGAGTGIEDAEAMHEAIMANGHGLGYGEPMDTSDRFADEEARVVIG